MALRVVTVVQARFGSSRLPGKALRPLCGRPMVLHVLERAAAIGYPTVLATTRLLADDELARVVVAAGYQVVRGSERDVLGRVLSAASAARADVIVRVTGDCPLLAPDVGRQVVGLLLGGSGPVQGIATNDTTSSGWPDGLDVEAFPTWALLHADLAVTRPGLDESEFDRRTLDRIWRDREHVTPWLLRAGPKHVLSSREDWSRLKLSVDTLGDFERVRRVMSRLDGGGFDWAATRAAYLRSGVEAR